MGQNKEIFTISYNPPYFLHKIYNYQKAVYERKGHWTERQKIKYGVFLHVFRDQFQDQSNPILNKMFRVMSDFIKTRNHNQCRSHHQKMQREKFEISSILQSISCKYHPREYQVIFEKYEKHLMTINIEIVLQQKGFTPHKNVENRRRKQVPSISHQISIQKSKQMPKSKYQQMSYQNQNKQQRKEKFQKVKESLFLPIDNQSISLANNYQQNPMNRQQLKQVEPQIFKSYSDKGINFENDNEIKNAKLAPTGIQYQPLDNSNDDDDQVKVVKVQIPSELDISIEKNYQIDIFYSHMHQKPQIQQNINFQIGKDYFEQSYILQIKRLDDQKQWHLTQANKLCIQMNEQFMRANACDQEKSLLLSQILQFQNNNNFQQ